MVDYNKAKMDHGGLEGLQKRYLKLTVGAVDDNGITHPNGCGPWAGDATSDEVFAWQGALDSTGKIPTDARLTRHEVQLAKWVAITEEIRGFEDPEKIPTKVQKEAERIWKAAFKEPKIRVRKQNMQLYMALPPGERDKHGGFEAGILWQTLESPMKVAELAEMVCEKFPASNYKDNPIGRMRTDIGKFNNGVFSCMNKQKPATPYPILGIEKKVRATAAVDETATAPAAE